MKEDFGIKNVTKYRHAVDRILGLPLVCLWLIVVGMNIGAESAGNLPAASYGTAALVVIVLSTVTMGLTSLYGVLLAIGRQFLRFACLLVGLAVVQSTKPWWVYNAWVEQQLVSLLIFLAFAFIFIFIFPFFANLDSNIIEEKKRGSLDGHLPTGQRTVEILKAYIRGIGKTLKGV